MTPQQKKQYILNNIDKYVVDGRRNFYWEDAEESMSYIYNAELENLGDAIDIGMQMSKRISQTKEDWGLDFLQDDIHNPILLYKNKKDGRIMYGLYLYLDRETGKSINDYKGDDEEILRLLRALGFINEEQKKILEEREREFEELIKKAEKEHQEAEKNIKKWQEEREKKKKTQQQEPPQNDKEEGSERNKNNPTQQPTNQEEEKNNFSTRKQPPITIQLTEQDKNIPEAITISKNQIQQVLKSHNLKTSDLPSKYQNWEKQLNKLTTKDQISAFVQEISQQIENKEKDLKREQNQKSDNKQHSISLSTKIVLGIEVSGVILGIIIFGRAIKRKKRLKKQGKL